MLEQVHTPNIRINWELISEISRVDRFDASWKSIEKREGQSLKQLKSIATVRSVGASTRIKGSKMSDTEVDVLLNALEVAKLQPREKSILVFIEGNPGSKSGQIAEKLGIPNPTVKRILTEMFENKLIERFGSGPGTNYSIM